MAVITSGNPTIFGTFGDDRITTTANPGTVFAGDGNDTIYGGVGNDRLNGGGGNDTIFGRQGNDFAEGGNGDDLFVWNPGDGNDTFAGGSGIDTLRFNGSGANEFFSITSFQQPFGVGFQVFRDVGNITVLTTTTERVEINAGDGNDTIDASGQTSGSISATLSGGGGNDSIRGGAGNDVIIGGDDLGDDPITITGSTLTGFNGGDTLAGGAGADQFRFDGNDDDHDLITDFQKGSDTLRITDTSVADLKQVVITSGPFGAGLLIVTDFTGEKDDGLFLQGVNAPLTVSDLGGGTFLLA